MFAQGFLESFWSDGLLFFVRVIATIGGAVVGWFACDPLTRGLYRLSAKGKEATPGAVLFSGKASGSALLAVIMWIIVPGLFGGSGGFGFGPGLGGGAGKGKDKGGDKVVSNDKIKDGKDGKDSKDGKDQSPKVEPKKEPLKIEILGGARFAGEDRYFLLKLKSGDAAYSLEEVETHLKNNTPSVIEIIHTDDTAVDNTEESPTNRLQKLASKYDVSTKLPKE